MHDDLRMPPKDTILDVKLGRIESDLALSTARSISNPGQVPVRYGYGHGNMIIWNDRDTRDLLFTHDGNTLRSNACRALWHMSPAVIKELIRGYRLARAAGLLGDGKCNEEAALFMSRTNVDDNCVPLTRDQLIVDGRQQMGELVSVLRAENRKPGGIKVS